MSSVLDAARPHKLITCVLAKGIANEVADALREDKQINAINMARGRGGSGRGGSFAVEMEILEVVVSADRADEIFEYLYGKLEVAKKIKRFMYQMDLGRATLFTLPKDVPAEDTPA